MSQQTQCATVSEDIVATIKDAIFDRPALIFAGQGAQEKGMGRELAEASPEAMTLWREAEKISGLPLREIYWEGDEAAMSDTRSLQPALTVVNLTFWNYLSQSQKIMPVACAGHSLGEFSALGASGVLAPSDLLQITSLRGRLMADADPDGLGAMAAIIKLDTPTALQIVEEAGNESGELIVAANFNTPVQTVVSGTKNAVDLACQKAKNKKGRGIELKVSGAFHSPMMAEANKELARSLEKAKWHDPKFPIYCNVDGKPAHTGEHVKQSLLKQMISPVFG